MSEKLKIDETNLTEEFMKSIKIGILKQLYSEELITGEQLSELIKLQQNFSCTFPLVIL